MATFVPIYTVDAFTSTPYAGNPAAICLMGKKTLTDEEYLKISKEMNLSETAFITETETPGRFGLRWYALFQPYHKNIIKYVLGLLLLLKSSFVVLIVSIII